VKQNYSEHIELIFPCLFFS